MERDAEPQKPVFSAPKRGVDRSDVASVRMKNPSEVPKNQEPSKKTGWVLTDPGTGSSSRNSPVAKLWQAMVLVSIEGPQTGTTATFKTFSRRVPRSGICDTPKRPRTVVEKVRVSRAPPKGAV
jgi:hypothetical protein